jgi:signal transduction histidine kinase/ActR/RegA family two-component response regulator
MLKAMVVEDELPQLRKVAELLEAHGWSISTSLNGEEALEKLSAEYDAVVLDLVMPIRDGESTLREIRSRQELNATCVVILTGHGYVESAVRALRLGAYQYLQKPFEANDLHRILVGGVAMQKAHSLRRKLLTALRLDELFVAIHDIITDTFKPSALNMFSLKSDGSIARALGGAVNEATDAQSTFVERLVAAQRAVFAEGDDVKQWNPLLANTKVLIGAPVFNSAGTVVGIIGLESEAVGGFDRNWLDVIAYLADIAGIGMEVVEKTAEVIAIKAEEERRKRDQLVQLAKGARHQFATPAQVIKLQAGELMSKEIQQLPEELRSRAERRLTVIQQNADVIQAACSYLDDIGRDVEIRSSRFDLVQLVENCAEEIEPELRKEGIDFLLNPDRMKPLIVSGDVNQLHYALQCVFRNAVEAIEQRRDAILDPDFDPENAGDRITAEISADPTWVTVRVRDTGNGIKPDDEKRLFSPMFTTKTRPQTGGLGLFTVKRIVDGHDGRVSVETSLGTGTTLSLSLPNR